MTTLIPQGEFWNSEPEQLRELFVVTKPGKSPICCTLWSHPLGYELKLFVGESFIRTQVVRDASTLTATAEDWKADLLEKGWQ